MSNSQTLKLVAGCLLQKDGKYLLVQEKLPKVYGKWNLPAGHVDPGESTINAAVREVEEETGLVVVADKEIFSEAIPEREREFHIFTAHIVGGALSVQPEEILDAQWFSLDEIYQLQKDDQLRSEWMVRAIENSRK
ncbi:MAG TPA: NUDIX hydrolase [Candidatus Saccharimonadales bacterium]|nr:NUDIX hydrolase [Candidatus Saccharimonadales bacterium]